MVRHVPQSSKWHKATDLLKGTEVYGDPQDMTKEWSVSWSQDDFNEFLFASGDFQHWAIIKKSDLIGDDGEKFFGHADVAIQLSSINCVPYKAKMLRRRGQPEDPWVSINNYGTANSIVYGGGSQLGNVDLLSTSGGNYFALDIYAYLHQYL